MGQVIRRLRRPKDGHLHVFPAEGAECVVPGRAARAPGDLDEARGQAMTTRRIPEPPPNGCGSHPPHGGLVTLWCRECGIFKLRGEYFENDGGSSLVRTLQDAASALHSGDTPAPRGYRVTELCGQSKCVEPARWTFVWPGVGRKLACETHITIAKQIGEACGLEASSLAIEPYAGTKEIPS
jgi:hypothetical protein